MRTLVSKFTRIALIASIPLFIMVGCESDLVEPENATPPKSGMKIPPGAKKL